MHDDTYSYIQVENPTKTTTLSVTTNFQTKSNKVGNSQLNSVTLIS